MLLTVLLFCSQVSCASESDRNYETISTAIFIPAGRKLLAATGAVSGVYGVKMIYDSCFPVAGAIKEDLSLQASTIVLGAVMITVGTIAMYEAYDDRR